MNKDCEIIQDLMPLVIDGVSSEKSREAVEAHVKECAECAAVYEDLKKDLFHQKSPEKQEKKDVERSLKTVLKKKKVSRFLKPFLLGMLIVALAVGSIFGYQYLSDLQVPLDPDQYDIRLFRMENGDVAVIADYKELNGSDQWINMWIEGDLEDPLPEDCDPSDPEQMEKLIEAGRAVRHDDTVFFRYTQREKYTAKKFFLGRKRQEVLHKGQKLVHNEILKFIRAGEFSENTYLGYHVMKGNDRLVWSLGDDLPAASEELETYYRYLREYRRIHDGIFEYSAEARGYVAVAPDAERRSELMQQHLYALEANLPELQPWIGEKPEPLDEETVKWAFSYSTWEDWGTESK